MKLGTSSLRVTHGKIIDGTGKAAIMDGSVHVQQGRITFVGPAGFAPPLKDATVIDAQNATILPGLVEAHFHPTYFNVAELADLDIKYPAEYVTLIAAANCKLALECGYTAARSCGSLHNIDVWLKRALESDLHVGPRLATSGREICGAGGLMDWNPEYWKLGMEGLMLLVNGPVEARAAVRKLVKDGVEWVKTYATGDAASPSANQHALCMTFEELETAAREAHNYGLKITTHARSTLGIKLALKAGYDSIEHASFIDQEGIDLLLQKNASVVPGLGFEMASVERGREFGLPDWCVDAHKETLEAGAESARKIWAAGGRLGLGGDYGFAWNPHGNYARELTLFHRYVGLSVLDVICCATLRGAEIMGKANDFGSLTVGKLADILVVEGDIEQDISRLETKQNFRAVIQGGCVKAGSILSVAGLGQAA